MLFINFGSYYQVAAVPPASTLAQMSLHTWAGLQPVVMCACVLWESGFTHRQEHCTLLLFLT